MMNMPKCRSLGPVAAMGACLVLAACGASRAEIAESPDAAMPRAGTPSSGDVEPRLLNPREISALLAEEYPVTLWKQGIGGVVQLLIRVGETGRIEEIRFYERSVHNPFNNAALKIAERMQFRPASNDGQPVAAWVLQAIEFSVE